MQNITIGQIAALLAFIVGLIGSVEYLTVRIKKIFQSQLEPIKQELSRERMTRLKADIVNYMSLAEQNLLIGKQKEIAYEEYDEYTKNGGNSYIHTEWERLQKLGKL